MAVLFNSGEMEYNLGMSNKPNSRRSSYKPEYDRIAYQMCLLGATDKQMAVAFGVTEQTINNWKKDKDGNDTSFFESIKRAKDIADGEVAEALYKRAMGYSHPEDKIFNHNGKPLIVPTIRHYPPDVGAIAFWLKNRQPALWRDKPEAETLEGEPLIEAIKQVLGK